MINNIYSPFRSYPSFRLPDYGPHIHKLRGEYMYEIVNAHARPGSNEKRGLSPNEVQNAMMKHYVTKCDVNHRTKAGDEQYKHDILGL